MQVRCRRTPICQTGQPVYWQFALLIQTEATTPMRPAWRHLCPTCEVRYKRNASCVQPSTAWSMRSPAPTSANTRATRQPCPQPAPRAVTRICQLIATLPRAPANPASPTSILLSQLHFLWHDPACPCPTRAPLACNLYCTCVLMHQRTLPSACDKFLCRCQKCWRLF